MHRILEVFRSFIFLGALTYGLSGDHVCQEEERYTVNVTQYYLRNVTTRSYKWCMQVPPRCSTFTYRTINDSRSVEEERRRIVDACCKGFEKDQDKNICIPEKQCLKCMNGVCNEERKCYCNPGFRGDYCEKGCDEGRWGRYCRYHCSCERGSCDPNIGHCYCPAGWTGIKCEVPCQQGRYGEQCLGICNCSERQICEPQTGRCSSNPSILPKYHNFNTLQNRSDKAISPRKESKKIDLYVLTTQTTTNLQTNTENTKNTERTENVETTTKTTKLSDIVKTNEAKEKSVQEDVTKNQNQNQHHHHNNQQADDALIIDSPITKVKKKHPEQYKDKEMFNFATISFAAIVFIAVTGIVIIGHLIKHDKPSETMTKNIENQRQSIFHSPLPEPPQSPFFETPLCSHYHKRIGDNQVLQREQIQDDEETDEKVDIFYDQLPPTNRCVLQVLDESSKDHYAQIHKSSLPNKEPVYDEIPCWTKTENEALYVNTNETHETTTNIENKTQF